MKKVVEIVHDIMRQAAKEGGAAADFTLGQGFDCAVLASCASIHTVYAFDVQLQAIQDARAFLAGKEGADKIRFIHDGYFCGSDSWSRLWNPLIKASCTISSTAYSSESIMRTELYTVPYVSRYNASIARLS